MPVMNVMIGDRIYDDIAGAFDILGKEVAYGFDQGIARASPLLLQSLNKIAAVMQAKHGDRWNGQVASGKANLQTRSGGGLASIRDSIKVAAEGGTLIAGQISAAKLSFHEEGGTIRASGSGYLTIPLPAALDTRGVALRKRARDWDFTFVKRSKKGNLLIFRRIPGARELTPLYVLKTSVYIRPRLGMEPAVNTEMGYFENKLFEEISDTIDATLGA
jgi:hypothetical protein